MTSNDPLDPRATRITILGAPEMTPNENALIGCMISWPGRVVPLVIDAGCREDWFSDLINKTLFASILKIRLSGKPIDIISVGKVSGVTAQEVDARLESAHTEAHAEYYLEQVHADHKKRQLMKIHSEAVAKLESCGDIESVNEQCADIQSQIASVDEIKNHDSRHIADIAIDELNEYRRVDTGARLALRWPIQCLNESIGPIRDELIYLIAAPSVGKTAFCLQWMDYLSGCDEISSLASLESGKRSLAMRLLAQKGKPFTDTNSLKNRYKTTDRDYDEALEIAEQLRSFKGRITSQGMTIDQFYLWACTEKAAGSRLLILDNLRHVRPSRRYTSTVEMFRDITLRLKWIRDDIGLPLVILHHTNKDDDASWSGDIRRDADIMVILKQSEKSILPSHQNDFMGLWYADWDTQKNREGKKAIKHELRFHSKSQYFEDENETKQNQERAARFSQDPL